MGHPGYGSHIVGDSAAESEEIMQRIANLCDVPEYQFHLPGHSEGDVVTHNNYAVTPRVVTDF